MTKVLYVAAWGRSGTTIVDNILDAYDGVFSAGELHYLWERGLLQGRTCGCGVPVRECELWQRVLDKAYGGTPPDPRRVVEWQREVTRVRHTGRLLRSRWPVAAAGYRDLMQDLYRAVAEVTGAALIVDSSKRPPGAALLARMPAVDGYLLHMVRDPRAVAYSWMRPTTQLDRPKPGLMQRHGPVESTAQWLLWNGLTERASRRFPDRYRLLRYEDFAAEPRRRIEEVLAFAGAPGDGGPFAGGRTVTLPGNHTVSGNPGRFRTGTIEVRVDDAWRSRLAAAPRLAVTAASVPMLHRYGYRLTGGR